MKQKCDHKYEKTEENKILDITIEIDMTKVNCN